MFMNMIGIYIFSIRFIRYKKTSNRGRAGKVSAILRRDREREENAHFFNNYTIILIFCI